MFRSLLGISWMWFFGAVFLSQFPSFARDVLGGDEQVASLLLVVFSVGIGAGAIQLFAAVGHAGRIATVFQNRRFDADFLTLQALLADGTLGDIAECHVHFDRYRPQVRDRWREQGHAVEDAAQVLFELLHVRAEFAQFQHVQRPPRLLGVHLEAMTNNGLVVVGALIAWRTWQLGGGGGFGYVLAALFALAGLGRVYLLRRR